MNLRVTRWLISSQEFEVRSEIVVRAKIAVVKFVKGKPNWRMETCKINIFQVLKFK